MRKLNVFKNYTILVLLIMTAVNYAQDSSKIVILSKYVGAVIDLDERNNYGFFQPFKENFIDAVIFLSSNNQYYCKIRYRLGELFRDTIIDYSYGSIRSMAAKVQYHENQKIGKTDFDLNKDVELKFADGEDVKNITTVEGRKIISDLVSERNLPLYKPNPDYSQFIANDFVIGLSAGVSHSSTKFDGLNRLFNLLEENIPDSPYVIRKSNNSFDASPLWRFSSIIIFRKTIMGEIEYAFSNSTDPEFDYQSVSFSISYVIPILENFSPYLSIGYSGSKFKVIKNYGVRVNNRSGTLESITFDGTTKGIRGCVGILFDVSENLCINLSGSYKFYPKEELKQGYISTPQSNLNVDMKGFEVGLGIIIKSD